jgi:hypothetical protein
LFFVEVLQNAQHGLDKRAIGGEECKDIPFVGNHLAIDQGGNKNEEMR